MTYVELIVVLTIFSTLSSVVVFNYVAFQDKIDVKNLTSDIALKVVEAQKSSVSGRLPPSPQQSGVTSSWRASYGLHFNLSDNKRFQFFTDVNQDGLYNSSDCPGNASNEECLDEVSIAKGGSISGLSVLCQGDDSTKNLQDLMITFVRPSGSAILKSSSTEIDCMSGIAYVGISVISPRDFTATVRIFPSGRIELK